MGTVRMSTTAPLPPPVSPASVQDGDIVVTRVAGAPPRFAILRVPGTAQVSWASKQEALTLARGFAANCGVDLWFDDGFAWTHVVRHRRR